MTTRPDPKDDPMTTRPLHTLPRDERFYAAYALCGMPVVLVTKDTGLEVRGVLVSVARSTIGTGSDFAVIKCSPWDRAFSLANLKILEIDDDVEEADLP